MIENFTEDPLMLGAGAVVIVALIVFKKWSDVKSNEETLDAETLEERLKKIFYDPVLKHGAPIKDWIKLRSTSNTSRTLGLAVRVLDSDAKVMKLEKNDDDQVVYRERKVKGTIYGVIPGKNKIKVKLKYFLIKLLKLSFLKKRWIEVFDVPKDFLIIGDDHIWIDSKVQFVKFNGINRLAHPLAMSRIWEFSFSKVHGNYLDASQKIPEQYATLNNRISGDIKLENIRSENIRQYKNEERRGNKKGAMRD